MAKKETAAAFFKRHGEVSSNAGKFNIYRIEEFSRASSHPHARRDFYKIMLITKADGGIAYADKTLKVSDNALVFGNPLVPYSWQGATDDVTGYFCLFTEDFISSLATAESISGSVLFRAGGHPVLYPDEQTVHLLITVFRQMLLEVETDYAYKYDLLRNYVQVIIHEALKISPANELYPGGTSHSRVSSFFLSLLERQFPITSPSHALRLKNASDFGRQLAVHTNHLNKVLRESTGKTTTAHINGRILSEAKALLLNSNWTVAEIGYCLGFEHPSNFNIFFKKQTGQTPLGFRRNLASIA